MATKNPNKSGVTTLVNVFVITSFVHQNLYDTRNTTVRGVCIEVGARNCASVCFASVTPFVNVVAVVSVRVAHTHDALVTLSMSTSASNWRFSKLNCLPKRRSRVVSTGSRWLLNGSRLIVSLAPTASERLICRVTGCPLSDRKLQLTTTSREGMIYDCAC